MKKASFVFCLLLGAAPALGADDSALSRCSEIKGNVERLECFDALTKSANAESPVTATEAKGDWIVETETSKINDSHNVRMLLKSKSTVPGKYGKEGDANFYIYCREGKTDVMFSFADQFLADIESYGNLTVRIDKRPASIISTTESTDHKALGLWGGTGIKFVRSLFAGSNLLVRVTPYGESPITTEFNITGLKEVVQPLAKACRWPSDK